MRWTGAFAIFVVAAFAFSALAPFADAKASSAGTSDGAKVDKLVKTIQDYADQVKSYKNKIRTGSATKNPATLKELARHGQKQAEVADRAKGVFNEIKDMAKRSPEAKNALPRAKSIMRDIATDTTVSEQILAGVAGVSVSTSILTTMITVVTQILSLLIFV